MRKLGIIQMTFMNKTHCGANNENKNTAYNKAKSDHKTRITIVEMVQIHETEQNAGAESNPSDPSH